MLNSQLLKCFLSPFFHVITHPGFQSDVVCVKDIGEKCVTEAENETLFSSLLIIFFLFFIFLALYAGQLKAPYLHRTHIMDCTKTIFQTFLLVSGTTLLSNTGVCVGVYDAEGSPGVENTMICKKSVNLQTHIVCTLH